MARRQLEDQGGQSGGCQTGQSHICVQIYQEEQLGSKIDLETQGSGTGNKASNPLTENTCGVEAAVGETPSLIGEFIGENDRVLECKQAHLPGN